MKRLGTDLAWAVLILMIGTMTGKVILQAFDVQEITFKQVVPVFVTMLFCIWRVGKR
jgi:hypothetical protein